MADNSTRVENILARHEREKKNRGQWMIHWDDLARIMLPRRLGFVTQTMEGDRRTEEIYDGTPMRSARGLANAAGQLMRPEGEKWFFIRAEDEALNNKDEVRVWIRYAEDRLRNALFNPKARFKQALGEADLDLVVFGTAVVFSALSRFGRRLQFNAFDLKDVVIALNDEGQPDTTFCEKRYTLRQAEQKFGREKLSQELRERMAADEKSKDEKVTFLRAVQPRPSGKPDAVLARNLPYSDDWIEVDTKHLVQSGGFHEFPFTIPRWDTMSNEVYGRSPAMIALPDAETLDAMSETILVSGQKAADAPVFAPNDSSFDAVNSHSGGITYYDVDTAVQLGGNPFFTLRQDFNLPITRDMQLDVRMQVEAAFFKNVFNLPVRGPEMTATEVITRKEEFIREIGPVFGRLETDYLAPLVERSFNLLMRIGYFNPIPEAIRGRNIHFEYTSPIKKIREQAEAAATRLWMQEIMELANIKPEVLDIPNFDEVARFSARALDLPPIVVNTRDKVESERAERKAQQAEMMERDKVMQEAEIAATGGKAAESISRVMSEQMSESAGE